MAGGDCQQLCGSYSQPDPARHSTLPPVQCPALKDRFNRWWPALKIVLALTILILVGIRFASDLRQLDLSELTLRPVWLVVSAVLYLVALAFSGYFWYRLLWTF